MMPLMLPWPPRELSPNARVHWAKRSRAAKKYRAGCGMLARAAGLKMPSERAILAIEFIPPDRRHRDDDNLIAAFKAGRDGIAQWLGIDDRQLVTRAEISKNITPGGAVLVTLEPLEA